MSLDYVFGPVVATDTLFNATVQFHRVYDRQEKERGWAWTVDGDEVRGDATSGDYETDPGVAIEALLTALRERLWETVEEFQP